MAKKRKEREQRFSAQKYFEEDDRYCPFKDVKLKPAPEQSKKQKTQGLNQKVYDMYTPGAANIVQKSEQMPLSLLKECSPQASCDLHGKRPARDDIPALVNEFLEESASNGLRKVEIIVGKGRHSEGEPVVPGIVESVLKNSPIVSDYECAPPARGGSGAFWIILGKRAARPVNVYATKKAEGRDIRGLENVKVKGTPKKAEIDYESYLPQPEDVLDKY